MTNKAPQYDADRFPAANAKPKQAPDKHGEAMQRHILKNCSRSPERTSIKKQGRK